jgi:lipopolysaccharide export system protein LptA
MCTWKLLRSLCAATALLCGETALSAEIPVPKPVPADSPNTTITSQRMTVRNQENRAIFEGSVVLTKGSLTVHSDVMVVIFKSTNRPEPSDVSETRKNAEAGKNGKRTSDLPDKGKNGASGNLPIMANRSVSMIEASGRVRIIKEGGQATCRKAVYHGDEDKIVLTGDPVAWQKGTQVTGQKIIMYLSEDRSVVEGSSRVMISPEGGTTQ